MAEKVIIMGGGPGGYVAAIRLNNMGFETTLIEKNRVGGVCLNVGCIPTKALYKSAEVYNQANKLESYGLDFEGTVKPNAAKIRERKNGIVDTLVTGIEKLLSAAGVEVILGEAKITGENSLEVNGETLRFDRLIIATGSSSFIPPIKGVENEGVITSTELLDFEEIPEELVIVGGGVIGMEFAGIFASFGTRITVLEALPGILPGIDGEIVKRLKPLLKKKSIDVKTSMMVKEIIRENGKLKVISEGSKGPVEVYGDQVLIATGRKANVKEIGLEEAGIAVGRRGIEVDENFETSIKGIYAIGDVNGKWLLAHAASAQGEFVAEKIAGESPVIGKFVPGCVFLFPEIASVGYTEEQLKEENIEYLTSKFMFGANGKALTMGEGEGLVKVIADLDYKIIGVHIMGPHASDLIHEGLLACEKGLGVDDFKDVIHAHPTLPEAFFESVMGLKGEAVHMVKPRR
ncbi:dihydrolipoyl dehydrogenase [Proteiniclasticum sp. C24MP]|uniref:dihydrolipoyl dehydrogenase n=1 Tax=Proteiniclasticum sp. C24MP TaxID=3374101 RepID=UPI003753F338